MDRIDPPPEQELREIGARLHEAARGARPSLFNPGGMRGRLLAAAMRDDTLRSALFQFVDVLPSLDSAQAIAAHFRAYLHGHRLGGVWGRLLALGELPWAAWAVRRSVQRLARQFLVEETPDALRGVIESLARIPAAVTVDAVGEAVLSEEEADACLARNLALLRWLTQTGARPPNFSLKPSALTSRFDPLDPEGTARRVLARLAPLLEEAAECGAALTLDMENHELKPLILDLFRQIAQSRPEAGWLPGIALQAYCPETERDLYALLQWARERGRRIGVRLVKGAYWDTEVATAAARHWPCPVYREKSATDAAYERLTRLLFQHVEIVRPAIAS
ncbi:MAG TPA: proline dehydrogenase family protein, partial [Burkholderiales bacterium]